MTGYHVTYNIKQWKFYLNVPPHRDYRTRSYTFQSTQRLCVLSIMEGIKNNPPTTLASHRFNFPAESKPLPVQKNNICMYTTTYPFTLHLGFLTEDENLNCHDEDKDIYFNEKFTETF